ncbi:MAG: hypothetical protein WBY94_20010, partial [Polyangiaceae bacterium]
WERRFSELVLPRFRPATVERYQRLFEADLQGALGSVRLDAIGAPESARFRRASSNAVRTRDRSLRSCGP